jgi:hypothetical protein
VAGEFPELYIVSWQTIVDDKAGSAFAGAFYRFLGDEIKLGRKGSIPAAIKAGEAAFAKTFVKADPKMGTAGLTKRPGGVFHVHAPTRKAARDPLSRLRDAFARAAPNGSAEGNGLVRHMTV